ncbi:hypothetical protein BLNAU_4097 [Blattamonas nauphoetae]|uniref:Uncharacterized protein n=1 Tax=Blattamonas nauphoetae TaxID=2049346 RepID=A0ABQ9YBE9_9EUKA|nr:hypothetical protein BLNAU_4097 [Blattamonas nauphoetae]
MLSGSPPFNSTYYNYVIQKSNDRKKTPKPPENISDEAWDMMTQPSNRKAEGWCCRSSFPTLAPRWQQQVTFAKIKPKNEKKGMKTIGKKHSTPSSTHPSARHTHSVGRFSVSLAFESTGIAVTPVVAHRFR